MDNFIKKSFKRELLFCFLAVAVLPLVVSCVFVIQTFRIKLEKDYEKNDTAQAVQVKDRLTEIFDRFEAIADSLVLDERITGALSLDYHEGRSTVYTQLYEATADVREFGQFDIYSSDGICQYSTGSGVFNSRLPVYWGVLREAQHHPGKMVTCREKDYAGTSGTLLRSAREILNQRGDGIGFLVISMNEQNFARMLQETHGNDDGICILDRFLENIYSTGTADQKKVAPVIRDRYLRGMRVTEDYGENKIYLMKIADTGLYSVLVRPMVFTENIVGTLYQVLLVLAALSLILCAAAAAGISNHLSKPIQELNQAMYEVQEGNLDVCLNSGRTDEFGQLSANFDRMTSELKAYMEQQMEQQKKLNEVQIAMMQSQLNPHFLYNTLDTIKWVAKANHVPEIATMSAKLAKILRTSISSGRFITLKEELDLVDGYMWIQRVRFNGKFAYGCELPEELERCMVPKLIVQPVVENAVVHGLADCEEGRVWVNVWRESAEADRMIPGDLLHIEVNDDGCGISAPVMERINDTDGRERTEHIGLYNVNNIIRLYYGEGYGVRVFRREEGGTRVVIVLPVRKEDERK